MKKLFATILLLGGLLTLAACVQIQSGNAPVPTASTHTIKGMIFVIPEAPEIVEKKLASLDRPQVIQYLYDLDQVDSPYLDPSRDTITVIHAVFGRLEPGSVVNTRWTVSRTSMPKPYSENYDYKVEENDTQSPFIILNSLYNENPGTFVFETRANGKVVASTTKTYRTGLNQ